MRVAACIVPLRVAPVAPVVAVDPELHGLSRARTRGPLRLALGRIAARLIQTRAWERLGFARLADYSRERTGLSARAMSRAWRRVSREHRVFERDGWRCTVPGCSSYRNLHDHHIVFRAAGGSDDLANRTTLCAWHHLRGVHAARVECRGTKPNGLVFELGLRAGGEPLLRYGSGERLSRVSSPGVASARP